MQDSMIWCLSRDYSTRFLSQAVRLVLAFLARIFFLCSLLLLSLCAQSAYFQHLTVEQGLSQGSVFDMEQDHQGFIWLATHYGLNRFDGQNVISFTKRSDGLGISSNTIFDIELDAEGNLWLATDNGLNYFNTKDFSVERFFHQPESQHSISSSLVYKTSIDPQGNLWLLTGAGLNRFDESTGRFSLFSDAHLACTQNVRSFAYANAALWLGSYSGGLCKFDLASETFSPVPIGGRQDHAIRSIRYLAGSGLWLATTQGLFNLAIDIKPGLGQQTRALQSQNLVGTRTEAPIDPRLRVYRGRSHGGELPSDWVLSVNQLSPGQVWVGTLSGLARIDLATGKPGDLTGGAAATGANVKTLGVQHSWMKSRRIISLFFDKTGLLWAGSNGHGVDIYNPQQEAFAALREGPEERSGLTANTIWELVPANGYIWLVTSGGLNRYDQNTGEVKHYQHRPGDDSSIISNHLTSVAVDDDENLWIGSHAGLSHFDTHTEKFSHFTSKNHSEGLALPFDTVVVSYWSKEGELWVGGFGQGLVVYSPQTQSIRRYHSSTHPGLKSDTISAIYQDLDGSFLLASNSGLHRYNPKSDSFKLLEGDLLLPDGTRVDVLVSKRDHQGRLLLGTAVGLWVLDGSLNVLKVFDKSSGLVDQQIYSVEVDDGGEVWVSTNHGISRVNVDLEKVRNFDISDGLVGYEFNHRASLLHKGRLYFGGFDGLSIFRADDIDDRDNVPLIAISKVTVNQRPILKPSELRHLDLKHNENHLAIEVSALDFSKIGSNQFAYYLEGFDDSWTYSGRRNYISYTNLDSGHYTLHVKAANKYGSWNEDGLKIPIFIATAPWLSWWAFAIYGFACMSLMSFLWRYYRLKNHSLLTQKLSAMSQGLSRDLDFESVQTELAWHVGGIVDYHCLLLFIESKGSYKLTYSFVNDDGVEVVITHDEHAFLDHFFSDLESVEALTASHFDRALGREPEADSWMHKPMLAVPLRARESNFGAVILLREHGRPMFSEGDKRDAQLVAAQASAAIDNARIHQDTKQMAFYDPLTSLVNRRLCFERLNQALRQCRRDGGQLALIFIDLDDFKSSNDQFGHEIGDAVLVEVAARLKQTLRGIDTIARIGGDEFLLILPQINSRHSVETIAQKIVTSFERPLLHGELEVPIHLSLGISLAPEHGHNPSDLMKYADLAMYQGKGKQGSGFHIYQPEEKQESFALESV